MATEIERKFLVKDLHSALCDASLGLKFIQGYLCVDPERTVRVRLEGEKAKLTVKGLSVGNTRPEFEYEIPKPDAKALLNLCLEPLIEKTRYRIEIGDGEYELDVFAGQNEGLVIAELELSTEDETFKKPPWLGREVSGLKRYFNSQLSKYPYCAWSSDEKEP